MQRLTHDASGECKQHGGSLRSIVCLLCDGNN